MPVNVWDTNTLKYHTAAIRKLLIAFQENSELMLIRAQIEQLW